MIAKELAIGGKLDKQIERLLSGRVSMTEIAYANIRTVVFLEMEDGRARILFGGKDEWNYDFYGNADDFLAVLSGIGKGSIN
jgi:hypothetical protein